MLPNGEYCDMPTVFEMLSDQGARVVAYPMYEPWLDVGRPDDLKTARATPLKIASG
jgi:NDP-sugar pyrophosphorylase family protein